MESTRNGFSKKTVNQQDQVIEVLYQKMGDRWFAFSLIDDEVFIGSITQNEIDSLNALGKETIAI